MSASTLTFFPVDLLPLFVVVPLLTSAISAILPWSLARRTLGLLIPAAGIIGGAVLLAAVSSGGSGGAESKVLSTGIGQFTGGVAIPLAADTLSALMIMTTAVVALAANWFAEVVGENRARFFPAMTLMLLGGVWGALLTADLFNLFVFIEIMLMPSFGLLTMTGTWARLAAGRTFILVNLITSMTLLAGVGLVYGVVGTTNIAALSGAAGPRGSDGSGNPTEFGGSGTAFAEGVFGTQWQLWMALGMVVIALAVKSGSAPVHTWLPRSYGATSPTVMALFSGLHTKVGVYAILRIYMTIFDGDQRWSHVILGFAVLGMLIGGFAGLGETTLRGVIAYQMVNGIPFILLSLAFLGGNSELMLSAAVFYMLHHMISAAAIILSAGAIEETYGTGRLRRLSGLMRRDPVVSTVFAAAALSLAGLPPFSGLWGKFILVLGISEDTGWKVWVGLAAVVIASIGALLSLLYAWRKTFWGRPMDPQDMDPTLAVSGSMTLPSAALMVLSLAMFFAAGPITGWTKDAAAGLTDSTAYVEAVLGDPEEAVGVVLPTDVLMNPYDPADESPVEEGAL